MKSVNNNRNNNNNELLDSRSNKSKFMQQSKLMQQSRRDNQPISTLSIEQIIDTFNLYIKSAHNLSQYLQIPNPIKNQLLSHNNSNIVNTLYPNSNNITQSLPYNINNNNTNRQSQQLQLIKTKIAMFISTTQTQLTKLNHIIQSSASNQLASISNHYHSILNYIKQKYSQLLKQTYRTLNLQSILSHQLFLCQQFLCQQDRQIVKMNKKNKLKQIKIIEQQLQSLWNSQSYSKNIKNININGNNINNINNINKQQIQKQQPTTTTLINFTHKQSKNPRNLQIISLTNNQQMNLRELAREQLQKQFLSIRIQAYNLYQKYTQHKHQQFLQRLQFVKQQQQILQNQLSEQLQLSEQIYGEYEKIKRQLNQIKTINQLIRKRYILRQSMRIDSQQHQQSLYHNR